MARYQHNGFRLEMQIACDWIECITDSISNRWRNRYVSTHILLYFYRSHLRRLCARSTSHPLARVAALGLFLCGYTVRFSYSIHHFTIYFRAAYNEARNTRHDDDGGEKNVVSFGAYDWWKRHCCHMCPCRYDLRCGDDGDAESSDSTQKCEKDGKINYREETVWLKSLTIGAALCVRWPARKLHPGIINLMRLTSHCSHTKSDQWHFQSAARSAYQYHVCAPEFASRSMQWCASVKACTLASINAQQPQQKKLKIKRK